MSTTVAAMDLARVQAVVRDTPHMTPAQAATITDFIAEHRPADILELGFRHGVSTCFMAEQLELLNPGGSRGHITTIDLPGARDAEPNVEKLLSELGLRDRVTVHYEHSGYLWRLLKMLEEDPTPRFDLCYLDGAHSWAVDGFAFFLVDRLLRPGGWIIFDDVNWSYASSPSMSQLDWVRALPVEEREAKQVKKIVDVLVRPHPGYGDVRLQAEWAFVQKLGGGMATDRELAAARREAAKWRAAYEGLRNRPAVKVLATAGRAARQARTAVRNRRG